MQNHFAALTAGLTVISETDSPVSITTLPAAANLPDALLAATSAAGEAQQVAQWQDVFGRYANPHPESSTETLANAERFRALQSALAAQLHNLQGWRIGEVQVTACVAGQAPNGDWVVVYCQLVET